MKVWVITLQNIGSRTLMRAYGTKEAAVAEMEAIKEQMERQMRYTSVLLEEVEGLLILSFYDDGIKLCEQAVMTELPVMAVGGK